MLFRNIKRWLVVFLLSLMTGSLLLAQEECPSLVVTVIDNLLVRCNDTAPDSLCYVHTGVGVSTVSDEPNTGFVIPGNTITVENTRNICSAPLDAGTNIWGVSLLNLGADLPEPLTAGIRLLLVGDAELASATGEALGTGFYLRTGMDDAPCSIMPESGLLIQVPLELGEVAISINGVDLTVNGSAYIQAQADSLMTVQVFTGAVSVSTALGQGGAVAGTEISIPLDETLLPVGPPESLQAYDTALTQISAAVIGTVADPPTQEEALLIEAFSANGLPLCGSGAFLPACDALISSLGGQLCPLNAQGLPDCTLQLPGWDSLAALPFDEVTRCDFALPVDNYELISTLPPGCQPGICLQDPAQACKCVLCGVACPLPTATAEPISPTHTPQEPPPLAPTDTPIPVAPTHTPCPLPFGCSAPPFATVEPNTCPPGQVPGPGGICIDGPPGS